MIIDAQTDRFVKEVIEGNEYSYLFHDYVVVDVGCNIGTFSFWIYDLAREIYAVDIMAGNIENLNHTIETNNLTKIKPYVAGISGKNEMRSIKPNGNDYPYGGWALGDSGNDIETFTLATFMSRESIPYIDILKLDVEGAELEILDSPDFPSNRVSTIVGELHDPVKNEPRFRKRLEELGYKVFIDSLHFRARKI